MFGIWVNGNTFGSTNTAGVADNGITMTNFQIEVVPEPATISMIAIFGSAIFVIRRRFMI